MIIDGSIWMETRNICIQRKVSECGVKYLGREQCSKIFLKCICASLFIIFLKRYDVSKGNDSIDHCIMVSFQCRADFHFKRSHRFLLITTVLLRDKICADTRILISIAQLHEGPHEINTVALIKYSFSFISNSKDVTPQVGGQALVVFTNYLANKRRCPPNHGNFLTSPVYEIHILIEIDDPPPSVFTT